MFDFNSNPNYEIIYIVVNYGVGSKILLKAKSYGIHGGTVCLGVGTIKNPIMNFLSLYDERKEILILGADRDTTQYTMVQLNKDFQFKKPNHGIMFSVGTCDILGSRFNKCENTDTERRCEDQMYHLIITIVDKGKGADVISASKESGANGGTIINARGSGENETVKIFNMEIEPEKEIVMILSKFDSTESVVNSIRNKMNIDKPGNGIVFVQTVSQVYGLFDQEQ